MHFSGLIVTLNCTADQLLEPYSAYHFSCENNYTDECEVVCQCHIESNTFVLYDWYELGGRWSGVYCKLKEGAEGEVGTPGVFKNKVGVDSLKKGDFDIEGYFKDIIKKYTDKYRLFRTLIGQEGNEDAIEVDWSLDEGLEGQFASYVTCSSFPMNKIVSPNLKTSIKSTMVKEAGVDEDGVTLYEHVVVKGDNIVYEVYPEFHDILGPLYYGHYFHSKVDLYMMSLVDYLNKILYTRTVPSFILDENGNYSEVGDTTSKEDYHTYWETVNSYPDECTLSFIDFHI